MLRENHIYSFDEIESSLHYDLLLHFLTIFMMNTDHSPILFTTQNQQLLDEEFIRRDIVWFTEKSKYIFRLNFIVHPNLTCIRICCFIKLTRLGSWVLNGIRFYLLKFAYLTCICCKCSILVPKFQ